MLICQLLQKSRENIILYQRCCAEEDGPVSAQAVPGAAARAGQHGTQRQDRARRRKLRRRQLRRQVPGRAAAPPRPGRRAQDHRPTEGDLEVVAAWERCRYVV